MPRTKDELIMDIRIQVAIWADESLFGHGLDDDDYEELCDGFYDSLCEVYQDLTERPR